MKICYKCKCEKPFEDFAVSKDRKDGRSSKCKECQRAYSKEHFSKNKTKRKEQMKKWFKATYEERKESLFAYNKEWWKNNKGKANAKEAKRKADKQLRTPTWADQEKIKAHYNVCSFFNEVNGYIKYHVDHIVPLKGKTVSGLHVHNNLQVILAEDNLKKHNKWSGY